MSAMHSVDVLRSPASRMGSCSLKRFRSDRVDSPVLASFLIGTCEGAALHGVLLEVIMIFNEELLREISDLREIAMVLWVRRRNFIFQIEHFIQLRKSIGEGDKFQLRQWNVLEGEGRLAIVGAMVLVLRVLGPIAVGCVVDRFWILWRRGIF